MTRAYIAGPMSGLPAFNYPAFEAAARDLRARGFDVVNPAENGLPPEAPWHQHMRADIAQLVTCDAIVMLPGWHKSRGATLENLIARRLGMIVHDLADLVEARAA